MKPIHIAKAFAVAFAAVCPLNEAGATDDRAVVPNTFQLRPDLGGGSNVRQAPRPDTSQFGFNARAGADFGDAGAGTTYRRAHEFALSSAAGFVSSQPAPCSRDAGGRSAIVDFGQDPAISVRSVLRGMLWAAAAYRDPHAVMSDDRQYAIPGRGAIIRPGVACR